MGKARSVSSLENEAVRDQKRLSAINNQLPDNIAGPFQNFPEPQSAIPKALLIEGGIMKGPIAFKDSIEEIASGKIDVGRTKSGYSSFVVIQAQTGTTDDLTDIDNPSFPGQIVYLQADTGDTITIKNSGNMSTSDGGDFSLAAEKVTPFMYVVKSAKWQQVFGTTAGSGTTLGGLTDVTITGAVKGDILVYDGAAWVDLTVGTDGFFLKALASTATGLEWASSSATEVPVWTQDHDADGYNFLLDTDGDSGIINDRDALIADDQMGIALGGLGTINYFFYQGGGAQNFDIIETASGDAFQIAQTTTTGSINTNALQLKIAGNEVVKVESNIVTLSQDLDMNGKDIIIDADGDTVIGDGGVDDQFQISTGGSARVVFSNTVAAFGENIFMNSTFDIDLNAQDLILDADNDTLISAAVDDNIQFTTGASARMTVSNSALLMAVDIDLNGVGDLIMDADADTLIQSTADDNIQIVTGASTRCTFSNTNLLMAMPLDMNSNKISNMDGATVTDLTTVTAVSGDFLIFSDTSDSGNLKKANASDFTGGGGVSFPITPTINDLSNTWTGNQTIDLSATDAHITKITLDQNLTWNTPTNPPSSGTQIEFEIEYVQDSTGGFTVTQWSEVSETVTIASGADKTTIVTYRTNDGGAIYHAIPSLRGSVSLATGTFATKELDNLGTTAINADLIMGNNDVTGLGTVIFTNGSFGGVAGESWITSDTSGDMQLNVADLDSVILSFENSLVWTISKSAATGNAIILSDSITLNDATADPAVNGEIQRNGIDLKVFTGGSVKNLTNFVSLADANTWTGINTYTNTLNANADMNIGDAATDTLTITAKLGANVDFDGYNLIFDTDGDSGFIGDRSALVGDDEIGIALGSLLTLDYLFQETQLDMKDNTLASLGGYTTTFSHSMTPTATEITFQAAAGTDLDFKIGATKVFEIDGSNAIFTDHPVQVLESVGGEAMTLAKTTTQGTISSTDLLKLQIAGTDELSVSATEVNLEANTLVFDDSTAPDQKIVPSGSGLKHTVPTGDSHIFEVNTTNILTADSTGILIGGGLKIKADSGTEIGIQVNNNSYTVGALGTIGLPTKNASVPAGASAIDTDFGTLPGACGAYINTTLNTSVLVIRQGDGSWSGVSMVHDLEV